jgi:hypothetical protein
MWAARRGFPRLIIVFVERAAHLVRVALEPQGFLPREEGLYA